MSSLTDFAKRELKLAGVFDTDSDYGGMLGDAVMELMEVFSKQGHSGCSASMTLSLFQKVADFKPLIPLTFDDSEWNDTGSHFQNNRNSAVFKESKDGKPYYNDAFYKKNGSGSTYSGTLTIGDGRVLRRCYIKDSSEMPRICIDIIDWEVNKETGVKEVGSGWWQEKMKDINQIQALEKYYVLEFTNDKETK